MKCFYCKAEIENGLTTYFSQLKNCIVIIKNVPCMKCSQCGEVFISGTVMIKIDEILDKCEDLMTEVAVVNFQNSAA